MTYERRTLKLNLVTTDRLVQHFEAKLENKIFSFNYTFLRKAILCASIVKHHYTFFK
jgi:hypothetical protein